MARFKPSLFDAVGVAAVIVMGYTLTLLVMKHTTGHGELSLELTQEDLEAGFREGYEYHGVYMGSRKIGAQRTDRYKLEEGFQMKTELELSFYGMRTMAKLDAVLDKDFRLSSFEAETRGGQLEGTMKGVWTGSALVVDADLNSALTGHVTFSRSFELPESPFFPASLWPVVMRKSLDEGTRVSIPYYDPESMQPITVDIIYRGKKDIDLMGQTVESYHFEEIKLGNRHDIYVSAIGEVLMEELPMGMMAMREPEAEARYGLSRGDDEIQAPKMPALTPEDAALERPAAWTTASRFILARRPVLSGLYGDAVEILDADQSAVVVETLGALPETEPLKAHGRARLVGELSGSLSIDVDDPELDVILNRFVAHRERADLMAADLTHHVHENVTFAPNTEHATGNATLVAKAGNALAQSRALVALLRAGGLASRLAHGALAVQGPDGTVRLVRHTWVEVFLSEGWVGLDPVLDQAPADSARLVVLRGELENPALFEDRLADFEVIRIEPYSAAAEEPAP